MYVKETPSPDTFEANVRHLIILYINTLYVSLTDRAFKKLNYNSEPLSYVTKLTIIP